jgi:transcriptional/translational regulatory protein YebC/TACO1
MIDNGAEEVFAEEEHIMLYGGFSDFGSIQKGLEVLGHEIVESGFERIPDNTKELTPEQEEDVEKLLAKFDDDEDVQNVYHSMG